MNDYPRLLNGPAAHRTWSKENPVWRIFYRTATPGIFTKSEAQRVAESPGHYLFWYDHTCDAQAHSFANHILERIDELVACKVSKFARDGEKVLVVAGSYDSNLMRALREKAAEFNLMLWKYRNSTDRLTEQEQELNATVAEHFYALARAYGATHDEASRRSGAE